MLHPSARAAIAPFLAMEVAREAGARTASGQSIVRFDVGQPGQAAPEAALRAAERAIRADTLGYSDGLGLPALRRAIADWYGAQHDLSISPDRIAITTGASGTIIVTPVSTAASWAWPMRMPGTQERPSIMVVRIAVTLCRLATVSQKGQQA
jgi:aspartate/methionine/tyrosine aminotransferase